MIVLGISVGWLLLGVLGYRATRSEFRKKYGSWTKFDRIMGLFMIIGGPSLLIGSFIHNASDKHNEEASW